MNELKKEMRFNLKEMTTNLGLGDLSWEFAVVLSSLATDISLFYLFSI